MSNLPQPRRSVLNHILGILVLSTSRFGASHGSHVQPGLAPRRLVGFAQSFLLISLVAIPTWGFAATGNTASTEEAGRRVSLTRSVEPSFRVEPVVKRLKGRRGETLSFEFELASTGKVMNLDVRSVNLRQEESGIILHDEQNPPAEGVTLTSPAQFQLRPGETFTIEGTVTVPLTKTNYMSFGLLVKDSGQLSNEKNDDLQEGQTRAAIRFVTQYVLRVDIETGAQDVGDMDQLSFDNARLIEKNGMPYVRAYLTNPTDFALESDVRAMLISSEGEDSDPVRLKMASRSELPGDKKFLIRIMPHSRLRLEGPIGGIMNSGQYDLHLKLSNGRRTMVEAAFPTKVDSSHFRGIRTQMLTMGDGLAIHPAQVEMGRVAGTDRMQTLKFTNHGQKSRSVELIPRDQSGSPIKDVMLSSKKFTIQPGRTKSIRAMLRGKNEAAYQWGRISVVTDESESALELALVHQARPKIELVPDELQWANLPSGNAFVMKIDNQGEGYAPLFAEMKLAATSGHPLELTDGYGRWLAPGKSRELQFYVPNDTQPGSYQIMLKVYSADETIVVERTLVLELTAEMLTPRVATR